MIHNCVFFFSFFYMRLVYILVQVLDPFASAVECHSWK